MVSDVNFVIQGKTNGDRLTVKTYGDGVIGEFDLKFDSTGTFNDTVQICFSYSNHNIEYPISIGSKETELKAYLGTYWLSKRFVSELLWYNNEKR